MDKKVLFDIDENLVAKFKAYCALNKSTMKTELHKILSTITKDVK